MKKYRSALGMLFVLMLSASQLLAQNSEFAVSTVSINEIVSGTADTKIVNKAGMTGKEVHDMLDAWCNERAGIDLFTLLDDGDAEKLEVAHFNTEAKPKGIRPYFDRTPDGLGWKWDGKFLIKEECCNIIYDDVDVLNKFLNKYFNKGATYQSPAKIPAKKQINDPGKVDCTDRNSDKKEKNMKDTTIVHVLLNGGSAMNNTASNNELWIFAILALIAIIALFFFATGRKKDDANTSNRNVNVSVSPTVQSMEGQWAVEDKIIERFTALAKKADEFRDTRNTSMIDGHAKLSEKFKPAQ